VIRAPAQHEASIISISISQDKKAWPQVARISSLLRSPCALWLSARGSCSPSGCLGSRECATGHSTSSSSQQAVQQAHTRKSGFRPHALPHTQGRD
jgi:hypothetical protein